MKKIFSFFYLLLFFTNANAQDIETPEPAGIPSSNQVKYNLVKPLEEKTYSGEFISGNNVNKNSVKKSKHNEPSEKGLENLKPDDGSSLKI